LQKSKLAPLYLIIAISLSSAIAFSQPEWKEKETKNFKLIFRESHSHLADHILISAEKSFKIISQIFDYQPNEKIVINTYDIYDYGFGSATTVPKNFIRLEIEPLEPGYENTPYNERFQWILSHELVHIFVNDQSSSAESFFRKIFGKVSPEQIQPLTIFYSYLTNYSRYTPRWHQESIAVFMETWLSGGFGRTLGNFDEMYFRSKVNENIEFPSELKLETVANHKSFLTETLFYLYGGRFAVYLVLNYGYEKFFKWFSAGETKFYQTYKSRFENIYDLDFDDAWDDFEKFEIEFQEKNLEKLKASQLSHISRITSQPFGMITQPYFNNRKNIVYFGNHMPKHLAGLNALDLSTGESTEIASLPTPSMFQVFSTGYDQSTGTFFYTTNNNQLYRDVWKYDFAKNEHKLLFENSRIGHLTVSESTRELWGIRHSGGGASLIYSEYPYENYKIIYSFNIGEEIQQLSVSSSGKTLAAVLHRSSGEQFILLADCEPLKNKNEFIYRIITSSGSPENPSWGKDEKIIYWNAFTNGVSNIYKYNFEDETVQPASHTLNGLFHPIEINEDTLFAFEFTSGGFYPVLIPNKKVDFLPAINYMGQKLVDDEPLFIDWSVYQYKDSLIKIPDYSESYNGLSNVELLTFSPIITGFQDQKVLGLFLRFSDPLINHDLTIEAGYSPFNKNPESPKYHVKAKYEYLKQWELAYEFNAPDFYDLFNKRKRGTIGTKYKLGYTHYYIFDNPLKVKQQTEVLIYKDIQFFNDNLIPITEPDFAIINTNLNSRNLRRTIGSSEFETGDEFNFSVLGFAANPKSPEYAAQIYIEWDHYTPWIIPHNIFYFKLASGYHIKNDNLIQSKFFFGGFGNRQLENADVKQYRNVFRLPGLPIYSIPADIFGKFTIENNFPPLRLGASLIGSHILNYIDASIYTHSLVINSLSGAPRPEALISAGVQLNFIFKHWANLESTFSAGIAQAWQNNHKTWEWFLSYKLLRN
jgi:hypothetical protein